MKTFKTFLNEAPWPEDIDPKEDFPNIENHLGSPNYQEQVSNFIEQLHINFMDSIVPKYGTSIGQGISRLVYKIPVNTKLFNEKQVDELDIKNNKSLKINTVIKIPSNKESTGIHSGVRQNTSEYGVWKLFQHDPEYRRWLCPIIDTSKQLLPNAKTNDIYLIQMPLCKLVGADNDPSASKLNKLGDQIFSETFGRIKGFNDEFDFPKHEKMLKGDICNMEFPAFKKILPNYCKLNKYDIEFDKDESKKEQQIKNIHSFAQMMRKCYLGDTHTQNYGVYNNNLVLIDYAVFN
jgi:hypothetical protein